MKKLIAIIFTMILLSGSVFSQSIGLFVGYGSSQFDEQGLDTQSKYVPVGGHILFGAGAFEIGAEISYAAVPFTYEVFNTTYNMKSGELKIEQLYYGALAKLKIGSGGGIWPYVRAGAGMYTGKMKAELTQEFKDFAANNGVIVQDSEKNMKSAFGFNLGGGVELDFSENNGLFGEIVYHFVNRQVDEPGSDSFKANNFAIQVGFHFGL